MSSVFGLSMRPRIGIILPVVGGNAGHGNVVPRRTVDHHRKPLTRGGVMESLPSNGLLHRNSATRRDTTCDQDSDYDAQPGASPVGKCNTWSPRSRKKSSNALVAPGQVAKL